MSIRYLIDKPFNGGFDVEECNEQECYKTNFDPGFVLNVGWGCIRVLKHIIIPKSRNTIGCKMTDLHSKDCPARYGHKCKGEIVYRDQFIQRLN